MLTLLPSLGDPSLVKGFDEHLGDIPLGTDSWWHPSSASGNAARMTVEVLPFQVGPAKVTMTDITFAMTGAGADVDVDNPALAQWTKEREAAEAELAAFDAAAARWSPPVASGGSVSEAPKGISDVWVDNKGEISFSYQGGGRSGSSYFTPGGDQPLATAAPDPAVRAGLVDALRALDAHKPADTVRKRTTVSSAQHGVKQTFTFPVTGGLLIHHNGGTVTVHLPASVDEYFLWFPKDATHPESGGLGTEQTARAYVDRDFKNLGGGTVFSVWSAL
jgi:hypothetical protein